MKIGCRSDQRKATLRVVEVQCTIRDESDWVCEVIKMVKSTSVMADGTLEIVQQHNEYGESGLRRYFAPGAWRWAAELPLE